jgi:hypothetical protein
MPADDTPPNTNANSAKYFPSHLTNCSLTSSGLT